MPRHSLISARPSGCVIKHRLPGRVRFEAKGLRGNHQLAHGIRTALHKVPGVYGCTASAASGTVLVQYDPAVQTEEAIRDAVLHAHRSYQKWDDSLEAREVEALQSVRDILCACDHTFRRVSGGHVGLRDVALSLVTAKALLEIIAAGLFTTATLGASFEVLLAWVLFRHPRLEREFTKMEVYLIPGI